MSVKWGKIYKSICDPASMVPLLNITFSKKCQDNYTFELMAVELWFEEMGRIYWKELGIWFMSSWLA